MATDRPVVVVTGSSGRIGTRLVERLSQSYQPIGLDFIPLSSPFPEMEFVYVDLSSDESVERAFNRIRYAYGNRIASIVHLAAYYSFSGQDLENYEKITVKGTARLLREAKKCEVEQFLFTSTLLVHNPAKPGEIINEDSPIEGKWHYPASKVRTEKLIREQHGEIPFVLLRIAGCYDEECNCVPISQHMVRIYEKQLASYFFPGHSSHGVPFIHFDDLVDMILLLIDKRREIPKECVLLAAEEDAISYRELQTQFGQLIYKRRWPMIWLPKSLAKVGAWAQGLVPFGPPPFIKPWMVDLADDNYQVSMERARQLLDWSPKRSLRRAIPHMVKNMLADPLAWYQRHGIPLSSFVKRQTKEKS